MVYRTHDDRQSIRAPVALGLVAFALSAMSMGREMSFYMPLGNLLLFMAPMAFGLRGALMAIGSGVIPIAIFGNDINGAMRVACVLLMIGECRRLAPWLPGYCGTLFAWIFVVIPLRGLFVPIPSAGPQWVEELALFCCLNDVLLSLVAGALLLNPTVWCFITHSPRHAQMSSVITHVLALTSTLTVFAVIATLNRLRLFSPSSLESSNELAAFGLLCTFVAIPTMIGFRLSLVTLRNFGNYLEGAPLGSLDMQLHPEAKREWFDAMNREGEFQSVSSTSSAGDSENEELKEQVMTGVCAIDGDGSVLFMNDRFRALTDIALPGTAGRTLTTLAQESALVRQIAALVAGTEPSREVITEIRIPRPTGPDRYLEVGLRPHDRSSDEGESRPGGIGFPRVMTIRDITDRRTIESHLLESQRLESLSAFVSGAATSLADTLTAISGRASNARAAKDSNAWKSALESISSSALQGGKLANQLLEFSAKKQKPICVNVDIRDALRDRLSLLQNIAGTSCEITLSTRSEELPVEVDGALLSQALTNLVVNSYESYGGNNGTIEVSAAVEEIEASVAYLHPGTRAGRYARLRVVDRGCGMPAEVLMHAADPLFTTKKDKGHSGLGLSTVHAIMREHNGFITIESRPEKGTAVSLYFPLSESQSRTLAGLPVSVDAGAQSARLEELRGNNQSVLVLESGEELREILRDMVSSLGYRAASCADKEEAIRFLAANDVDIILLNESLSSRLNHDVLSKTGQNARVRSVLMTTALDTSDSAADGTVRKPFDLEQLGRALRSVSRIPAAKASKEISQEGSSSEPDQMV